MHFMVYLDSDDSLKVGEPSEKIKRWLRKQKLPSEFLTVALRYWPQDPNCELGHITMNSSLQIYEDEEITPLLASFNFFNAGSSSTGDFFVVDLSTKECVPGFITLSEWDRWAKDPDPRPLFQPIARSFDSFLYRVVEKLFLPVDYYSAQAFNKFLKAEGKQGV